MQYIADAGGAGCELPLELEAEAALLEFATIRAAESEFATSSASTQLDFPRSVCIRVRINAAPLILGPQCYLLY